MNKRYSDTVSRFIKRKTYNNTYINLTDNNHMEIENCKRILEYNDLYIKIRTSTLTVCIYGQNLDVSDYNNDGIIIDGKFSSIEFEWTILGGVYVQ